MDSQQEYFIELKARLEARGYAVYDGALPPPKTAYPFIYLGEFRQSETTLKNAVTGSVHPVIHVWHNSPRQRGTVSNIILDVKTEIRQIERTETYSWLVQSLSSRILPDGTTSTPLLHGVVEAGVRFS